MSGPVMLLTSRTRADCALYGPSSGIAEHDRVGLGAAPPACANGITGADSPGT